jgi:hypothetical protein
MTSLLAGTTSVFTHTKLLEIQTAELFCFHMWRDLDPHSFPQLTATQALVKEKISHVIACLKNVEFVR